MTALRSVVVDHIVGGGNKDFLTGRAFWALDLLPHRCRRRCHLNCIREVVELICSELRGPGVCAISSASDRVTVFWEQPFVVSYLLFAVDGLERAE